MLPAAHRIRLNKDFVQVRRQGRARRGEFVTIHLLLSDDDAPRAVRVGFVVGKIVGNSVIRSRVTRRLRHIMRPRLAQLPAGAMVVIRARERAGQQKSEVLADEIDRLLERLLPAGGENNE